MSRSSLSWEEHLILSYELEEVHEQQLEYYVKLASRYGPESREALLTAQVMDAVLALRAYLHEIATREHPGESPLELELPSSSVES